MSGMAMTMQLRKLANHPLLLRYHYTDDQLRKIAAFLARSSSYKEDNEQYVFEDLAVMSDYQIYQLISNYKVSLSKFLTAETHRIFPIVFSL